MTESFFSGFVYQGISECQIRWLVRTCLTSRQSIKHVLINDVCVRGESPPLYWSRGEGATFWAAWADEEASEKLKAKPL